MPTPTSRARLRHAARVTAHHTMLVLAVLSVLVLTAAATARSTVVNRAYYQQVLDDTHTYDRLYDQVLVDPALAPYTTELLGSGRPLPSNVITTNIKNLLPPSTTRELTDEQIRSVVDYLRGDERDFRLSVDVRPVLANLGGLGARWFGTLIASAQHRPTADYREFLKGLDSALEQMAAGRPPGSVPVIHLDAHGVRTATQALLFPLPESRRDALRPAVTTALKSGDAAAALAAVGPDLLGERAGGTGREIATITARGHWNAVPEMQHAGADLTALQTARSFTRLGLGLIQYTALGVGLASLAGVWATGPRGNARRLRRLGIALGGGGLAAAAAVGAGAVLAGRIAVRPPAAWPLSVSHLVEDIQHEALHKLLGAGLGAAAVPLAAGALLVGASAAWQYATSRGHRRLARLLHPGRPARLRAAAAATAALALMATAAVPVTVAGRGKEPCNGSVALCGLRYDQAAYLATHNAMSTSANHFIVPLQDLDITGQLDAGARALLLDTHTWETPGEVGDRLSFSDFGPGMQHQLTKIVEHGDPHRPGLWLCHAVCGAGAEPLVPTLRTIKEWMDENPREVVTLDIEDHISGEQTRRAFHEAGLDGLLRTPDPDPAKPWPTLGEMVDSGRRLVVFAEKQDGPAPWYRNFYRYGMETPYGFRTPEEMSCAPNRGGTGKRLFLMNHFITAGTGSRIDAGKVNARDAVLDRAHRCGRERHHPVNFVAVDYLTIGDAKGAVDTLNAERTRGR